MTSNVSFNPGYAVTSSPRLLDQVRDHVRYRHYSLRTEQAYVHWIKRYIFFHARRHPAEMGRDEIVEFLTHLASDRNVAEVPAGSAYHAAAVKSHVQRIERSD